MENLKFERLSKEIVEDINNELIRIGLLYRVFHRVKSTDSIERKMSTKKYVAEGKKMQDLIGVRIIVYFKDDLELVKKTIKTKFNFIDESVDEHDSTVFKPTKVNLIIRMNEYHQEEIKNSTMNFVNLIDSTYEVQLRTIFSEGWHEIEHDLRYKCQDEWEGQLELSRTLNGIYASLETNDWSILTLFEQLAYSHYKAGNLEAMIRNKFRIRFLRDEIESNIERVIEKKQLLKSIYRIDRKEILDFLIHSKIKIPLKMNNLIFLINHFYLKEKELSDLTPTFIKDRFKENKYKKK
jgi:putative GTP pyrophosphokinase